MSIANSNIELTTEQKQLLADVAAQTGQPWERVLAGALANLPQPVSSADQRPRSLLERMNEDGFLGCITDAPADLSTNPAYMEGFGTSGK